MSTRPFKNSTKKILVPFLEESGFIKYTPSQYIKIKNDIVFSISFCLSSKGTKLIKVFFTCNSIYSPRLESNLDVILVGDSYFHSWLEGDDATWIADSDENAEQAMLSIIKNLTEKVFPFFDKIDDHFQLLFQLFLRPERVSILRELSICLLKLDEAGKAFELCEKIIDDTNKEHTDHVLAKDILKSWRFNRYRRLLPEWKENNLSLLGMSVAV